MTRAFQNAPLYAKLIERYNGKVLPGEQGIKNTLVAEYGINKNSADRVVKIFSENCRNLKLVDTNNRLRVIITGSSEQAPPKPPANQDQKPPENIDQMFRQIIPLSGNKVAYFEYPKTSLNKHDFKMIELMMPAILGAIKFNVDSVTEPPDNGQ